MQNIENTQINLTLSLAEVNGVLTSLANMPYGQVATLIEKIRELVVPQLPTPNLAEKVQEKA